MVRSWELLSKTAKNDAYAPIRQRITEQNKYPEPVSNWL